MRDARLVITDCGGVQEETTALGVPCLTFRDNTERPITIEQGIEQSGRDRSVGARARPRSRRCAAAASAGASPSCGTDERRRASRGALGDFLAGAIAATRGRTKCASSFSAIITRPRSMRRPRAPASTAAPGRAPGHQVTVVTCAPNHPRGKIYPGYRNRLFQREMVDGVEVVRLWTLLCANEGFLLRTLNYLSFLVAATAGRAVPAAARRHRLHLAAILLRPRRPRAARGEAASLGARDSRSVAGEHRHRRRDAQGPRHPLSRGARGQRLPPRRRHRRRSPIPSSSMSPRAAGGARRSM